MELLKDVVPSAWEPCLGGADYSEVYVEESNGTSIHFEDSRAEEMTSGSDRGVGLRYLRRSSARTSSGLPAVETVFGSLNRVDADAAIALSRRLRGTSATSPRPKPLAPLTTHSNPVANAPEGVPFEAKIALLGSVDRAIRADVPHIRQVSLTYAERSKAFLIATSEGDCRREERRTVILSIQVTAEKDGVLQTGYEVIGGLKGWELFLEKDPVDAGMVAARRAVEKLTAPPSKAGEMAVVLSSAAGGTFVHEAIGHSLEADHVQEGTSPHYRGTLGKIVAPEFLTIIDDPTLPFARGSYAVDDEGVAATPVPVVQNGVHCGYLYDRVTAIKDGLASNAHGRRESYHHKPIPRMSNLYIASGKDDPDVIVKELARGLFVTRMGGGQVDTATGEFVFEVEEGFFVEDGRVRHMVRDANLLGVGPEVLKSIDRLGSDLGWAIGTCGKEGQGVPVSDGQPTLRIPKLLVGGVQ
ncbi:MAG: TldD/PmbA family protein [Elusimicrobia bacterium]|nr:TldD/PmbA family protein [Elusimicrobiota bacterium]